MEHFNELYRTLNPNKKEQFLRHLLETDELLRNKFLLHFKHEYEQLRLNLDAAYMPEDMMQRIQTRAEQLRREIEEADFTDLDWDGFTSSRRYVTDYEVAGELSEGLADQILVPWLVKLKVDIQLTGFVGIVANLTAMMLATKTANINDPYDYLTSRDYFGDQIRQVFHDHQQLMTERRFNELEMNHGFDLLLRTNKAFFVDSKMLLNLFQDCLIAMIPDKNMANIFDVSMMKYETDLNEFPRLSTHLALLLGDEKRWIEALKAGFGLDYETSVALMDYLFKKASTDFEEWASKFYMQFRRESLDYLRDKVAKGTTLHLDILKELVIHRSDYDAFTEIKVFIGTQEQDELIEKIYYPDNKALFYAREKDFEKIEKLIDSELMRGYSFLGFNYRKAIQLVVAYKPDMAWQLVKKIIEARLVSERKRETYTMIAGILADSLHFVVDKEEVQELIGQLYSRRPNLPALKDEFRKAGLIK